MSGWQAGMHMMNVEWATHYCDFCEIVHVIIFQNRERHRLLILSDLSAPRCQVLAVLLSGL